jgi:hypothetical protein
MKGLIVVFAILIVAQPADLERVKEVLIWTQDR